MSALDELSDEISAYPNAIRVARAKAGMSNEQLAELSGVPYSTVCKVQSGLQNITLPQAAAIYATLGISLDALIGLPESAEVKQLLQWARDHDKFTISLCHGPAAFLAAALGTLPPRDARSAQNGLILKINAWSLA